MYSSVRVSGSKYELPVQFWWSDRGGHALLYGGGVTAPCLGVDRDRPSVCNWSGAKSVLLSNQRQG
jgi:hypothetical protein